MTIQNFKPNGFFVFFVSIALLLQGVPAYGEAIDDRFTQISPQHAPGAGEYIHGKGYGKILMRVMVFGATPHQGIHYFPEGTDLLFSLLYAGGKMDVTSFDGIKIRRRGIRHILEVNLDELIESGRPIPKLQDGDVVEVPYNWRKNYNDLLFYTGVISTLGTIVLSVVAISKL